MGELRRAAAVVPTGQAEEARAAMISLFPGGFEEVERDGGVELAAYTDAAGEEALRGLFRDVRAEPVEDGWEDRWREFHRPVRIGELWIGPPWLPPDEGSLAVVIDPARAFGTGAHPSTRLALWLLAAQPRGSLLDVGCGSGVLSIAAARLGFAPVIALDSDPLAVEAARENAARNGVPLDVRLADALAEPLPPADVAVANIALAPVEALGPRLDVAVLVAAGYLASDEPAVPGFRRAERAVEGEWAADVFLREKQP